MRKLIGLGLVMLLGLAALVPAQVIRGPGKGKGKKDKVGKDKAKKDKAKKDKGIETPSQTDSPDTKSPKIEYVGGKTLAQWKADLTSKDASVRAKAIVAITGFGDENAECVPLLINRTYDSDLSPRVKAILALRTVAISDKDFPKVVEALSKRISLIYPRLESDTAVRYEAIITLQRFSHDATSAIPALVSATLDKGSWEVRLAAVQTLTRAAWDKESGPDARATRALLQAMRDPTYQVKLAAIQGLGSMGKPQNAMVLAEVIKALNDASRHSNKPLAIWAFAGLVAMDDNQTTAAALAAIAKFLKSEKLETRAQAAQALGALGTKAKSKVPALLTMLKDKQSPAVAGACAALASIGDNGTKVTEALSELSKDKNLEKAVPAIMALTALRCEPQDTIKLFEKELAAKDLDKRKRPYYEKAIEILKKPAKDMKKK